MEAYSYFLGTDEFTPSASEFYYKIEVILQDQSVPQVSVNHMPIEPINTWKDRSDFCNCFALISASLSVS